MNVQRLGVSARFPALSKFVKTWNDAVPEPIGRLDHLHRFAYEGNFDLPSVLDGVPSFTFNWVTSTNELRRCSNDALLQSVTKAAVGADDWRHDWLRGVAYSRWAFNLYFNFHCIALKRFERGDRPQPLAMIPFTEVVWTMSNCWLAGWRNAGLQLFEWIIRGLDHAFFIDAGTNATRRAQYFCLRLIAAYLRREEARVWPSFVSDEPIYESLLQDWAVPNPSMLVLPILAACDRHTHQAGPDTNRVFRDFNAYPQMYQPFEVLLLLRLRQSRGLELPVVEHPLLSTPLGKLHEEVPEYSDELLRAVVARAEQERPQD